MIPKGYCQCGCGEETPLATETRREKALVKGEPRRYLTGHHRRKPASYKAEDRGYETPCWIWQLSTNQYGYGRLHLWNQRRVLPAHRWYYERERGPIAQGLQLDHLCRVPRCVNPDHLEPVTLKENVRRGLRGKVGYSKAFAIRLARWTTTLRLVDLEEMFGLPNGTIQSVLYQDGWWPEMAGSGSAEDAIRAARAEMREEAV